MFESAVEVDSSGEARHLARGLQSNRIVPVSMSKFREDAGDSYP
jgi:hypothetical protein